MKIVSKAVATVEQQDIVDEAHPHGGFIAVLSTPSLDRDGDRLLRDEWVEPLPDRVPLDIDHGMSVADTVGSFRPYFDGDRLMMDAAFASTDKAQDVRSLVNEGHISTVSVAFMCDKSLKDAKSPYRELLNAGIVAIPSNRDAVILASKAASALKDALEAAGEDEGLDDVKKSVQELLGVEPNVVVQNINITKAKSDDDDEDERSDDGEDGPEGKSAKGVYVNVIPKIDPEVWRKALADGIKAAGGEMALISAIHDASVHLGAICVVPDADPDPGASSGANKDTDNAETKEVIPFDEFKSTISTDESPAPAPDEKSAAAAADLDAENRCRAELFKLLSISY